MGKLPHTLHPSCFGLTVAAVLRERYPRDTAKLIARDLKCSPKSAENLLNGHLSARSITRLTLAYGLGFLIDAGARLTGVTLENYIIEKARAARLAQEHWDRRGQEYEAMHAALATGETDNHRGVRGRDQ